MNIRIFQINHDRDKNDICFTMYDRLPFVQGTKDIDSTIYDEVFSGEVNCDNLEDVFEMFNINQPKDYKGRSLSISDVVEVNDNKTTYHYCDEYGFRTIDFNPELSKKLKQKEINDMTVDEIKEQYPVGSRIELINMEGEMEMYAGLKGTVTSVDDIGQIHMKWDNGSSLALNKDVDSFKQIDEKTKIKVLLVEPGKTAKPFEIDDSLESMQEIVGGYIEEYMPFDDEVAIICNEEGKLNNEPLNRAIYGDPKPKEVSYWELKEFLKKNQNILRKPAKGYVVFTEDSFENYYTEEQRTYEISSNNKAFMADQIGSSIYGSCIDGSDDNVRLDLIMEAENGGTGDWKIEKCYINDGKNREILDIVAGKFFIAYAPAESEKFLSMPDELMQKYEKQFKYPERFYKTLAGEIVAEAYKPRTIEQER